MVNLEADSSLRLTLIFNRVFLFFFFLTPNLDIYYRIPYHTIPPVNGRGADITFSTF